MTVLSNIITPSNVLTTTNTATVTNKTLTSPTVTGMTVSDGTANGVTYLNGSKVLTSGSALTFDGASLGIGTTSPIRRLTVSNSGAEGLEIGPGAANGDTAGAVTSIYYNRSGSAYVNAIQSASNFIYQISGTEAMRLTSTGLGIGTSSPSEKLQVVGKILATGDARIGVKKAGSDSVGAGPFFSLQNADASREWFNQLGASNTLDWWYYNGSSYTKYATLDSAGNLGLGVTPSAWDTGIGLKAFQFSATGCVYNYSFGGNNFTAISDNFYINSSGTSTYLTTNTASQYRQTAGAHQWFQAPSGTAGNAISFTQAMTLDASGNFLVGTTTSAFTSTGRGVIEINGVSDGALLGFKNNNASSAYLYMDSANNFRLINNSAGALTFGTNGTERARITSDGNVLVGKTSSSLATQGAEFNTLGAYYNSFTRSGGGICDFNRLTDDGELIAFWQDTTKEGNISVSGTTVSYNGGHLSRYAQTTTAKDDSLLKGTVLSNLDEMNVYTKDEQSVANEQLNKVKVSDTEGDVNVAGVFVNWSHDEDHNVDEINMAMTGDMIIRIAQGTTVVRGDLLMSAGDGTAKPQGDDIVRSKTVAKVTSNHVTCTYADGSYCVPCVLMAC